MTVKRMDNVGIVVEDIDAAMEFFTGVPKEFPSGLPKSSGGGLPDEHG